MEHELLKSRLEDDLALVVAELSTIAVQDPGTGDWMTRPATEELGDADSNVEADMVEEWGTRTAVLEQLETRYRNLTRALKKMGDGTYGICEISGEPIEIKRLEANPAARTNIANRDREAELPL